MQTVDAVPALCDCWSLIRKPAFKVREKGEQAVRSTLVSLRPQFSLLSGAVLVLLTLFLPVAYNACGPQKTGAEFAGGASGELPLILGVASERFGRGFYVLALAFAVITLSLVLLSISRRKKLDMQGWTVALYAGAGTLSLYILADAICWTLSWLVIGILEGWALRSAAETALGAGLVLVALAFCLRARLLRSSSLVFGLLAVGTLGCLFVIEFYLMRLPSGFPPESAVKALFYFLAALYWLVPAYLWYRFGLLPTGCDRPRWRGIRSGILRLYLPALACVPLLFWAAWDEGVWGFIPFSIGIHLMSLGYMRLAPEQACEVPAASGAAVPSR